MSETSNGDAPARAEIQVRVGDRHITVGRFKGYTATRIMREAAKIGRAYPKIGRDLARYRQEYAAEHSMHLSRAQAEYQLGAAVKQISEKAWEQAGGELVLPRSPTLEEQVMTIYPELMDKAEEHVLCVLALIATTSRDLEEAWTEGGDSAVNDLLDKRAHELLFEADATELLELALAGAEVGRAQFAPLGARVKALLSQLGLRDESPQTTNPEQTTTPPETEEPTTPAPDSAPQSSSTDSPTAMDGPPERPSSVSPGPSSVAASSG